MHYDFKLKLSEFDFSSVWDSKKLHVHKVQKKIPSMFTKLTILCCHLVCGCGGMKSPCKFHKGKKNSYKKKVSSPKDSWKVYLKTWAW